MIEGDIARGARALEATSDSPRLDAELLLAHVLDCDRHQLRRQASEALHPQAQRLFDDLLARRTLGEPVAYLIGHWDFWTLHLRVTPAVLVPRPETELLVELALQSLRTKQAPDVLDLGTGSGAVGLAIASERADATIDLSDLSGAALQIAELNRSTLGFSHVHLYQGAWLEAVPKRSYDVIVANPPYLGTHDPHLNTRELGFEPRLALVSGPLGLEALQQIAQAAPSHLKSLGELYLEHGYQQGSAVRTLLTAAGFVSVTTHRDLAGLERVTSGIKAD
jgi:release factor glutamine methyltransferase